MSSTPRAGPTSHRWSVVFKRAGRRRTVVARRPGTVAPLPYHTPRFLTRLLAGSSWPLYNPPLVQSDEGLRRRYRTLKGSHFTYVSTFSVRPPSRITMKGALCVLVAVALLAGQTTAVCPGTKTSPCEKDTQGKQATSTEAKRTLRARLATSVYTPHMHQPFQ